MGNCNFKSDGFDDSSCKFDLNRCYIAINKSHFKFHCIIVKGGFGKGWKVERKKFGTFYALKEMSKVKIVNKKSVNSVMNEKKLLSQLKHP